jgi:hypothetical protein
MPKVVKDIKVTQHGTKVLVSGDTFPIKEFLKRDFTPEFRRWNSEDVAWEFSNVSYDKVKQHVDKWILELENKQLSKSENDDDKVEDLWKPVPPKKIKKVKYDPEIKKEFQVKPFLEDVKEIWYIFIKF